jgi:hypothetical protein
MHNTDEKDLLQANATIIPGVLILLTLTTSFSSLFNKTIPILGRINSKFWDDAVCRLLYYSGGLQAE